MYDTQLIRIALRALYYRVFSIQALVASGHICAHTSLQTGVQCLHMILHTSIPAAGTLP
jgi:hypothetical protein